MLYCVGGVSGSGKSTLINAHPVLRDFDGIDIADFYSVAASHGRRLSWRGALDMLVNATRQKLNCGAESLALEALFKPGSAQRRRIRRLAAQYGQELRFIWCHAPREVCRSRVENAIYESPRRRTARLRIISRMADWCFMPVPGEDVNQVIGIYGYYN